MTRSRQITLGVTLLGACLIASCGSGARTSTAVAPTTVATTTIATVAPTPTTKPTPTATARGPRPASGAVIVRRGGRGQGTLEVDNGTDRDAYVTMARGGKLALGVYVRNGETAKVTGIADGTYVIYFSSGTGWNSDLLAFTADKHNTKFDDTFDYVTTSTTRPGWKVTLQPSVGGNASTSDVSGTEIPS